MPPIEPTKFYFSVPYFARDVVWSTGSFTVAAIGAVALSRDVRQSAMTLKSFVQGLLVTRTEIAFESFSVTSDGMGAAALAIVLIGMLTAYIVLASVSGILAEKLFIVPLELVARSVRHLGWWFPTEWITYEGHYRRMSKALLRLYREHFSGTPPHYQAGNWKYEEIMIRLTALMRIDNPAGYEHVYRTYAVVMLLRQLMLYQILLSGILFREESLATPIVLALVLLLWTPTLWYTLEYSVNRELSFIVATARSRKLRPAAPPAASVAQTARAWRA